MLMLDIYAVKVDLPRCPPCDARSSNFPGYDKSEISMSTGTNQIPTASELYHHRAWPVFSNSCSGINYGMLVFNAALGYQACFSPARKSSMLRIHTHTIIVVQLYRVQSRIRFLIADIHFCLSVHDGCLVRIAPNTYGLSVRPHTNFRPRGLIQQSGRHPSCASHLIAL
jgi:hypothetical protein